MNSKIVKVLFTLNVKILFYINKIKQMKKKNVNGYNYLQKIVYEINKILKLDIKVVGKENIPKENFIIFSNHRGLYDPLLIMSQIDSNFGFVMKKSLSKYKFFQDIATITNTKFFARTPKEDLKTILDMIKQSKNGINYLIFPEGTRNEKDEMLDFKNGCFKIPIKSKCDIVPIVLLNTEYVFDKKDKNIPTLIISILPNLKYDTYKDMKTTELATYVKELMQKEYDKLKEELI